MKTRTYKFYNDSGHGWLAVKRKELELLGILEKISSYSYQKGETVYLEEDLDAGTFVVAYHQFFGVKPTIVEKYHNGLSPIRYYRRFFDLSQD